MTKEELNQIKAASYDAAYRGAIAGAITVLLLFAIFIWLFRYDGFSLVLKLITLLISIIVLIISALPDSTFVFLGSIIFGIFILAILWSAVKVRYVANRNRKKLKTWREHK